MDGDALLRLLEVRLASLESSQSVVTAADRELAIGLGGGCELQCGGDLLLRARQLLPELDELGLERASSLLGFRDGLPTRDEVAPQARDRSLLLVDGLTRVEDLLARGRRGLVHSAHRARRRRRRRAGRCRQGRAGRCRRGRRRCRHGRRSGQRGHLDRLRFLDRDLVAELLDQAVHVLDELYVVGRRLARREARGCPLEACQQVRDDDRLPYDTLGPHARERVVRGRARHHEDRNAGRGGIVLDAIAQLEQPVAAGQLGREQNEIEAVGRGEAQSLVGVAEDGHVPGALRERLLELESLRRVVFQEENLEVHRCTSTRESTPTDAGSSWGESNAKPRFARRSYRGPATSSSGLPVGSRKNRVSGFSRRQIAVSMT